MSIIVWVSCADMYGQGCNSARVRQQSRNAALPEIRLQGGGART